MRQKPKMMEQKAIVVEAEDNGNKTKNMDEKAKHEVDFNEVVQRKTNSNGHFNQQKSKLKSLR